MDILVFSGYTDIGEYMYNKASEGQNITATLFLDDTIGLMRKLMSYKDIEIGGIDVAQIEYNGYSKEYYVTLSDDLVLDIEPAWNVKSYLSAEPDVMLIDGNANSAIIKDIPHDMCKEIYIGEIHEKGVFKNDNEILDTLFDNAKIVKDNNDTPIGIAFNINEILEYLLY